MNTIQHWKSIIKDWDTFVSYPGIYSFILYSPLDKNMIKFFSDQDCWNYLDRISTDRCLNFIIAETKPGFPTWFESPEETDEPDEFYEIADAFDINEDQIPCLIFFRNIDSRLEERVVWEIGRTANLQELRMNFDKIYKLIDRPDHSKEHEKERKKIFSNFKRASWGQKVVKKIKKSGKWVGRETIRAFIKETYDRLERKGPIPDIKY